MIFPAKYRLFTGRSSLPKAVSQLQSMESIGFTHKLTPRASVISRQRLLARLRTVAALTMPERQFTRLIQELELDPLFQRLFFGVGDHNTCVGVATKHGVPQATNLPRVFRRQPWPDGRLSDGFYVLREETMTDGGSADIGPLLERHSELLKIIQKMGRERFERYFLHSEGNSLEEITEQTGLPLEKVHRIHELVLELSVLSEFYVPPHPPPETPACSRRIRHPVIAEIETGPGFPDKPTLLWTSLPLARGRYAVDQDALGRWKESGTLSPRENRHLKTLLEKIDLINARQKAVFRVLEATVEKQREYLCSQRPSSLKPLTMRALARDLGMAASTVSRVAAGRSVLLPWKAEAPLAGLFPGRHRVLGFALDEILSERPRPELSDASLALLIRQRYGLAVSRRSVNDNRRARPAALGSVP